IVGPHDDMCDHDHTRLVREQLAEGCEVHRIQMGAGDVLDRQDIVWILTKGEATNARPVFDTANHTLRLKAVKKGASVAYHGCNVVSKEPIALECVGDRANIRDGGKIGVHAKGFQLPGSGGTGLARLCQWISVQVIDGRQWWSKARVAESVH